MLTRRWLMTGLLLLVGRATLAQDVGPGPATGNATLKETLVFGLRPRTPDDNEFINLVVLRVEQKVLPIELVMATYRWALGRKPYPYPYFERGLRARARQQGIVF